MVIQTCVFLTNIATFEATVLKMRLNGSRASLATRPWIPLPGDLSSPCGEQWKHSKTFVEDQVVLDGLGKKKKKPFCDIASKKEVIFS